MVSCPSLLGNRNSVEARPLHRWTPRGDAQGRRQPLFCRGEPPVFAGGGTSPVPAFPRKGKRTGGRSPRGRSRDAHAEAFSSRSDSSCSANAICFLAVRPEIIASVIADGDASLAALLKVGLPLLQFLGRSEEHT